jgi:GNAT superfamily N-acetyltransferase
LSRVTSLKIDVAFCESIELAEAAGLRSAVQFGRGAYPDRGLLTEDVAGGMMAYAGADSPFNQAQGIGIRVPVSERDIDTIVEFYHSRSTAARIILTPLANLEASSLVARRGFVIEEFSNTMSLDLSDVQLERDARVEVCTDPKVWSYHSARAFGNGGEPDEPMLFIGELMAAHPNVVPLMVREDGAIAATACFAVENNGIAALFAASTAPEYRGRGYQSALICDRLARAREAGARVVRAGAMVGSASERNFRRYGFTPLFTRSTWILKP